MERNVLVTINGLHDSGDDTANVATVSYGKCYEKGNKYYISYEEIDDESGMKSNNLIKISGDSVELIRRGGSSTRLFFQKGRLVNTYFDTVMGRLFMGVDTKSVDVTVKEKGIYVLIKYVLIMEEEKVADSSVEIAIEYN